MRIAPTEVTRESNFNGESFAGRLNTAKLGSFMQNLIKNYNDPAMATLREWVSNAWDSHQKAGQTKPIKVTLPTRLATQLVVEDFGLGMSYEEVRDVYAVLLTSTKDEDDLGIGGFGIGGKSALAIADQYTMVSIKDGLKNVFIFERSSDGGLDIQVPIKNQQTEEPNGVKVSVAVDSHWVESFNEKSVNRVLRGWKSSELELVGGSFESLWDTLVPLGTGLYNPEIFTDTRSRWGSRTISVLVGPVYYSVDVRQVTRLIDAALDDETRRLLNWLSDNDYAIQIPIGSVTFPSSREVIEPNAKNMQVIADALRQFVQELQDLIQNKIDQFNTLKEAWNFVNSALGGVMFRNSGFEFKGRTISSVKYEARQALQIEGYSKDDLRLGDRRKSYLGHKNTTYIDVDPREVAVVVRVTEEHAEFTPDTYRKYLRGYVLENFDNLLKNDFSRRSTIIITDKTDDLHEITSDVVEFASLKANPPKTVVAARTPLTSSDWQGRFKNARATFLNSVGLLNTKTIPEIFKDAEAAKINVVLVNESAISRRHVQNFARAAKRSEYFIFLRNQKDVQGVNRGWKHASPFKDWFALLPQSVFDELLADVTKAKELNEILGGGRELLRTLGEMFKHNLASDLVKSVTAAYPALDRFQNLFDLLNGISPWNSGDDFTNLLKSRFTPEQLKNGFFNTRSIQFFDNGDDDETNERSALFLLLRNGTWGFGRQARSSITPELREVAEYVNWSFDRFIARREEDAQKAVKKAAKKAQALTVSAAV